MARCPRCAVRQYAPTPYASSARCVVCDTPLVLARVGWGPRVADADRRFERARPRAEKGA